MTITTKPPADAGAPNSKTTVSESAAAIPVSKTTVSESSAAIPVSKTTISESSAAIPVSKTTIAESSAAIPVSKTTISESSAAIPVSKTTIPGAAVPRALTPLVDMHFDSEQYSQRGSPISFDDLFTYARNSSATFINRRVVNNKAEFFLDTDFVGAAENLLLFNEQFDNAAWAKTDGVILLNATRSPINDLTADKLQADSTGSISPKVVQAVAATMGSTSTVSVFVKQSEAKFFQISFTVGRVVGDPRVNFDVNLGLIGARDSNIIASIVSAENGWFLLTATFVNQIAEIAPQFGLIKSLSDTREQANSWDSGDGLFIWGAQGTMSVKVLPYIQTFGFGTGATTFTETLRIEYNPLTGENLGALIEGASTNLLVRSEELDDASWNKTSTTIIVNDSIAPDGATSADKVTSTFTANTVPTVEQSITSVAAQTYTQSFYVKRSEAQFVQIAYGGLDVANDPRANFDLVNGVLGTVDADIIATIANIGNGYFRITSTVIAVGVILNTVLTLIKSSTDLRFHSNPWTAGEGLFLWGAQAENMSFATSYIRTGGSTVSRAADSLMLSAIGNFNESSGSVVWEGDIFGESTSASYLFSINDDTGNNVLLLLTDTVPAKARVFMVSNNVTQADFRESSVFPLNQMRKTTVIYATNDLEAFVNGVSVGSDSSAVLPTGLQFIDLGQTATNTSQLNGHIKAFTTYADVLTAQEVALL